MVTIHPLDDVWVRVDCDDAIARELGDYFTFESPGAQFMRRQARYKHWDGRIRLFKLKTRTIYRGLVPRLLDFCQQRDYDCQSLVNAPESLLSDAALDTWLSTPGRLPFAPRSYQRDAIRALLDLQRGIILSPTGSGKSFIIYIIAELLRELAHTKTLIVVPTIGLVNQLAKDFRDYGFDLDKLHTISAGAEKDADAALYISTWQSIYKLPSDYFAQFDCIIVDEVHQAKAKSLSHLMEKAHTTRFRFGFTGTLDDTEAHQLILEGLFGSVTQVTTTAKLQKSGELAKLHVKMTVLQYPETERKQLRHAQYDDEIDYLCQHAGRNAFLTKLVASLQGNVLVLFNYVEKHGKLLYERFDAEMERAEIDKDVHFIHGGVDADTREAIRQCMEHAINQVAVASYGTFSTGINIRNIRHIVFASPSKSKIRVIQSIGRGLRTHEDKTHTTLWDVVDDLRIGKHVNFAMKHAEQRSVHYANERFPVTLRQLSLDKLSHLVST